MASRAVDAASQVAMAAIKEWWQRHIPPTQKKYNTSRYDDKLLKTVDFAGRKPGKRRKVSSSGKGKKKKSKTPRHRTK